LIDYLIARREAQIDIDDSFFVDEIASSLMKIFVGCFYNFVQYNKQK
tara:strand:- start:6038 stop:6178 length:141 start_codon:yes stop_codon:yes gene_type:complete